MHLYLPKTFLRRLNSMTFSRASSRVKILKFSNVSGTDSVPIFRVLGTWHPEDGDAVSPRHVGEFWYPDMTACPIKLHRITFNQHTSHYFKIVNQIFLNILLPTDIHFLRKTIRLHVFLKTILLRRIPVYTLLFVHYFKNLKMQTWFLWIPRLNVERCLNR
jgi:hypothetical protein